MNGFISVESIAVASVALGTIYECVDEAIEISRINRSLSLHKSGPIVSFEFNDTPITVRSDSNADDICREYFRVREAGTPNTTVVPYPLHIRVGIKANTNLAHEDSQIPLEALVAIDAPHGENPDYGNPANQPISGVL